MVKLSWPPVKVSDLDGYAVYRIDPGSNFPERVATSLVRDTSVQTGVPATFTSPAGAMMSTDA